MILEGRVGRKRAGAWFGHVVVLKCPPGQEWLELVSVGKTVSPSPGRFSHRHLQDLRFRRGWLSAAHLNRSGSNSRLLSALESSLTSRHSCFQQGINYSQEPPSQPIPCELEMLHTQLAQHRPLVCTASSLFFSQKYY